MTRRRREPHEAKSEILAAAEKIVFESGPQALKIQAVAKAAGMTHPTVLHHFGSASGLITALQHHFSRQIRVAFLDVIDGETVEPDQWLTLFKKLSDPKLGRMLCYLIAQGTDPFPPAEEGGLGQIVSRLPGEDLMHKQNLVLTVLYAMYGEAIFGPLLRMRMGVEHTEQTQTNYQRWLLDRLSGAD